MTERTFLLIALIVVILLAAVDIKILDINIEGSDTEKALTNLYLAMREAAPGTVDT